MCAFKICSKHRVIERGVPSAGSQPEWPQRARNAPGQSRDPRAPSGSPTAGQVPRYLDRLVLSQARCLGAGLDCITVQAPCNGYLNHCEKVYRKKYTIEYGYKCMVSSAPKK